MINLFLIPIREIKLWIDSLICLIPGGIGFFLRKLHYSIYIRKYIIGLRIETGVRISYPQTFRIGENSFIGMNSSIFSDPVGLIAVGSKFSANSNVMLNARGGGLISIGNSVSIGPNVVIRSNNHVYMNRNELIINQGMTPGSCYIGDDVWIAANVVVLPNVKIGNGAVIGAGSIVTQDIPDYAVAIGNPARVIRFRSSSDN